MKKNDIFTFTAPNGVEVTAVVVDELTSDYREETDTIINVFLCYAQNRVFTYFEEVGKDTCTVKAYYGKVLIDYAFLPDYDKLLVSKDK